MLPAEIAANVGVTPSTIHAFAKVRGIRARGRETLEEFYENQDKLPETLPVLDSEYAAPKPQKPTKKPKVGPHPELVNHAWQDLPQIWRDRLTFDEFKALIELGPTHRDQSIWATRYNQRLAFAAQIIHNVRAVVYG